MRSYKKKSTILTYLLFMSRMTKIALSNIHIAHSHQRNEKFMTIYIEADS